MTCFNPTLRSVEIVALSFANVGHRVSYMAAAMRGSVLGKVGEHLHGERAHLLRQIIRPSHGYWLSIAGGLPFYSDIGHRIFSRD